MRYITGTRQCLHRFLPVCRNPAPYQHYHAYRALSSFTDQQSSKNRPYLHLSSTKVVLGAVAIGLGYSLLTTMKGVPDENNGGDKSDPLRELTPKMLKTSSTHLESVPLSYLYRAWLIQLLSSSNLLIKYGANIFECLQSVSSVPLIGPSVWAVARYISQITFWEYYVGASSSQECIKVIQNLLESNKCGSLLNYSVEAVHYGEEGQDLSDARLAKQLACAHKVDEIMTSIQVASGYEAGSGTTLKPTSIAIKLTGLVPDAELFRRVSNVVISSTEYARGEPLSIPKIEESPMISDQDGKDVASLYGCLLKLGQLAKASGVRLVIDAEQTWYQPLIDAYYESLAQEFNVPKSEPPVIYTTVQCNLKSGPEKVDSLLSSKPFSNGIKLVRGAYTDSERNEQEQEQHGGHEDPTWANKEQTDLCYNECLEKALKAMLLPEKAQNTATVGLVLATHNLTSVRRSLEIIRELGYGKDTNVPARKNNDQSGSGSDGNEEEAILALDESLRGRFCIAQLKSMSDNLTNAVVRAIGEDRLQEIKIPFVYKYVPYGRVEEVLPYLLRRAQENQSVLGGTSKDRNGASDERKIIAREIRRRLFSFSFLRSPSLSSSSSSKVNSE